MNRPMKPWLAALVGLALAACAGQPWICRESAKEAAEFLEEPKQVPARQAARWRSSSPI